MKKIYIILATLLVTGLSSCDMEKYPYSSVEESQYLATLQMHVSEYIPTIVP